MNKIKISLLVLLFLTSYSSFAQDTLRFSLQDAIAKAMTNNKSIQTETLIRESIKYQRKEANSYLLPTVNASAGINHYLELPQSFLPSNLLNPMAPAGEVVGLQLGLPNTSDVGINAQWILYNQSLFTTKKVLNTQAEMTELQITQKQEEVTYNVSLLYYAIVFSEMQMEVISNNIKSLEAVYRTVESNYRNGLVKKTDLDKVEINILNLKSQLQNTQTQTQSQKELLKLNLGLQNSENMRLTDNFDQLMLANGLLQTEAKPTTDLLLIGKKRALSDLQIKLQYEKRLPTLSLNYGASYNWVSNDFRDLYSSGLNYPVVFAGLKVSVPVFNGGRTSAQINQAKVNSQIAEKEESFLKDKVSVDIKNALNQYNQYKATIEVRQRNIKLAKEVYDQSLIQYKEGLILLSEVLTNEISVREAESQYLMAVSQSLSGLLAYKKAAGLIQENKQSKQ
jgi:outer membrane protein